ncbi:peptidylprolyl isomerase [Lacihabitans sp. LS3-19]|uniref:FKBP-type peptidyl-prolyl cis-trans isomerase n=1 Tax=Lacihabitans sp. LS3-19 TaxID=2487335 RepID=UPI0020CC3784|nr:peptidylprolyl isomerase [Lacihabitans sp. LS3-19]
MVKTGDIVSLHYKGTLNDGTVFDSSEGRDPLEFEVGSGMVIKGFDDGVMGMAVGEKKSIHIGVNEAYGPSNEQMIFKFDKAGIPGDVPLEVGGTLNMHDGQQAVPVVIREIGDSYVLMDANHPLAGQELNFELEMVAIKDGSNLEVEFDEIN